MEILKRNLLIESKWIQMKEKIFKDQLGRQKSWEYIERTGKTEAVIIVPVDKKNKKIILIKQYRLPFENYVIEFPAGLIDKGETIENTACRELLEETGFKGEITSISPKLSTSAGLTSETIYMIEMEIDINTGNTGKQRLEASEDIEVLILDTKNAAHKLINLSQKGYLIDSKVWTYLVL